MLNGRKKILKDKGAAPTEIEEKVAQTLFDIEVSQTSDIKGDMRDIYITAVTELEVTPKSALILHFPYRVWAAVQRIQGRLIRELEKKFAKNIVFVANRTILDKNFRRRGIDVRPRSRTLTKVHEALLEDIVGPTEIVGKRTRVSVDGTKLLKLFLDPRDKGQGDIEAKLATYSAAYKKLTHKNAEFMFQE